ncbi:hypothetical protein P4637_05960 [Halalkalibacterium halodurans]|nr:hypothetical protein [Halalkalibacterium halodurans]MDY7223760.1 hypothetical protein [Halalkalibacterium halodurans]MDY7242981.1 hypothetical protein [Halalkalibacterium halodurans]MED4081165.1 hypothetical protein [Halalkalibacterium halodurans]MED4084408.1 hypothetical protein [Halalkalibacterium halodurans]MED4103523.1 hypothetical protein [Halalkalibacterium halodurans]
MFPLFKKRKPDAKTTIRNAHYNRKDAPLTGIAMAMATVPHS